MRFGNTVFVSTRLLNNSIGGSVKIYKNNNNYTIITASPVSSPFELERETEHIQKKRKTTTLVLPAISFEPIYRIVLYFTQWNDNTEIARRIVKSVPIIRVAEAMRISQNAASYGTAIVITAPLSDAQVYLNRLTNEGLKVSLDVA